MGVGKTREEARRDQEARDRANREAREAQRRKPARKFSWQQPGGTGRSSPQDGHRYQACTDEHCDRFPCRVYKEGYRNGWQDGHVAGYAAGFPDGIAACPRAHK